MCLAKNDGCKGCLSTSEHCLHKIVPSEKWEDHTAGDLLTLKETVLKMITDRQEEFVHHKTGIHTSQPSLQPSNTSSSYKIKRLTEEQGVAILKQAGLITLL